MAAAVFFARPLGLIPTLERGNKFSELTVAAVFFARPLGLIPTLCVGMDTGGVYAAKMPTAGAIPDGGC